MKIEGGERGGGRKKVGLLADTDVPQTTVGQGMGGCRPMRVAGPTSGYISTSASPSACVPALPLVGTSEKARLSAQGPGVLLD